MASQAPGEPSDRRSSGRKRNADTYRQTANPPFEVKRATLSSQIIKIEAQVANDNDDTPPTVWLRLAKNGKVVTMESSGYTWFGSGNEAQSIGYIATFPTDWLPPPPNQWHTITHIVSDGVVNESRLGVVAMEQYGVRLQQDLLQEVRWTDTGGANQIPPFTMTWVTQ